MEGSVGRAGTVIAVVEDEVSLRRDLVEYLRGCGYDAREARNGRELTAILAETPVSIAILDVNLPGEDGFSIAARLREATAIGIIMVTARGASVDRVVGLEVGADAYMVKPLNMRELEAQVKSLLRRLDTHGPADSSGAGAMPDAAAGPRWILRSADWSLTSPGGVRVPLTSTEMKLVTVLAAQAQRPVSRQNLSEAVYGRAWDPQDRTIDTVVRRLRGKVEKTIGDAAPLKSEHGVGYVFSAPIRTA